MKFKQIHLLLCIISSSAAISYRGPCSQNLNEVHDAVDVTNIKDTCLCPPPVYGFQVADKLHKQNSDLERVVIFYYRDKTNNEVYMYTPSIDKQLSIPELQFDTNDDFKKIDNQISLLLFEENPANTLPLNYQYPKYQPHGYYEPKQQKLVSNQEIKYYPTLGYEKAWADWFTSDKLKGDGDVEDDLSQYIVFNDRVKNKWVDRYDEMQAWRDPVTANMYKGNDKVDGDLSQYGFSNNRDEFKWTNKYKGMPAWHNQLTLDRSKGIDNLNAELSQYFPLNAYNKNKWADRYKILNSKNLSLQNINNAINSETVNGNSNYFDNWYGQNVIQFPEIYSGDAKYISFNDLREHLPYIFHSQGYSIINNQILDPHGQAVDSSDFKLVRVKIKHDDDEQNLSSEVDGIMIININPMTILGIVPITKVLGKIKKPEKIMTKVNETYEAVGNAEVASRMATEENSTLDSGVNEAVTTESSKTSSTPKTRRFGVLYNNIVDAVNTLIPRRRESNVDSPGYRIIGGMAATGSGAPISSKGRSGSPN